jgi:anti-sigma factor RsiW
VTPSSECNFGPLLSPYVDGELPPDRHEEVAMHVPTCGSCAAELDGLRRFSVAIKAMPRPPAPLERIADRLVEAAAPPAHVTYRRIGFARHARWMTAVAATVCLFATGRLVYLHSVDTGPTPGGVPSVLPASNPGGTNAPRHDTPKIEPIGRDVPATGRE